MLRTLSIGVLAIVIAVAFARTLTFGRGTADRPPAAALVPARPAPATPPPAGGVVITVTTDGVSVRPASVRAQHGSVGVRVVNQASHMVEVVLKRRGVHRLLALGSGEQRDDALALPAGGYIVQARPLTEGGAPPAPATGVSRLRVLGD